MGWRIKFEKNETSMFLITWIRKIRHRGSGRPIGQHQFLNQKWFCTSKAIAQIMSVFILSIYELLTQVYDFINVAVMPWTCLQALWTRWSLFRRDFCSKGNLRLRQSRSRLWATELTCAYQADLKNLDNWTWETHNHISSPAWWNKSCNLQTNRRWSMIW